MLLSLFGHVTPQPANGEYRLPTRRRVFWEYGHDMVTFLIANLICNVLLYTVLGLLAIAVLDVLTRPAFLISRDQGYVFFDQEIVVNKLRADMLRSFINTTTERLYTVNPGSYDISDIEHFVSPRLYNAFIARGKQEAKRHASGNWRQLWTVLEIRGYNEPNPKLQKFVTLAIKGHMIEYNDRFSGTLSNKDPYVKRTTLMLAYLDREIPSPKNPWGLRLVGIAEVKDPKEAAKVWKTRCVEFISTPDIPEDEP